MKTLLTALSSLLLGTSLTLLGPDHHGEEPLEIQGGSYAIDASHSSVVFGIRHLGVANFYGRFNAIGGSFTIDPKDMEACSIEVAIVPGSVDTGNGGRNDHAMSPDFLDVENHELMGFRSQAVKVLGPRTLEVTGKLTMHGVSKEVTAQVELIGAGDTAFDDYRAGAEARFTLNRSDFGMDVMLDKLGDEISVLISLEGIHQG